MSPYISISNHSSVSCQTKRVKRTCENRQDVCDGEVAEVKVGHVLSHKTKLEYDNHDQKVPCESRDEDDDVDKCQHNHPLEWE